jgi:hypothetical protein
MTTPRPTPASAATQPALPKEVMDQFCHEALDCYHHFRQSRVIFDQDQNDLDVLNDTARHFFSLLNNMFLDGIVLNMARLTDPPETFGKKNLSIRTIQEEMSQDPRCPTYVYPLFTEIHGIADESKLWRHKRGAHIGFNEAMGLATIPPLYIEQVQRFYDLLQIYINWIYEALFQTIYPIDAVDTKGADELLRTIRYAYAVRQYQDTHIRLFDQIVNGRLPSAHAGPAWRCWYFVANPNGIVSVPARPR